MISFMTLVVIKHSNTWSFLGSSFQFKGPKFQKMMNGFLQKIEPIAFDLLVKPVREKYAMKRLIADGTTFRNHPYAIEPIDVKFQL